MQFTLAELTTTGDVIEGNGTAQLIESTSSATPASGVFIHSPFHIKHARRKINDFKFNSKIEGKLGKMRKIKRRKSGFIQRTK